jgi:hypothetical protein
MPVCPVARAISYSLDRITQKVQHVIQGGSTQLGPTCFFVIMEQGAAVEKWRIYLFW